MILSQLDVTVFMTSEVNEQGYSVFGVEEFIADGIIYLSHEWTGDMESKRRIRVVKLRGLNYDDRATIFRTTSDGIQVYPFAQRRMIYERSNERVSTGVPGLDRMSGGGFFCSKLEGRSSSP